MRNTNKIAAVLFALVAMAAVTAAGASAAKPSLVLEKEGKAWPAGHQAVATTSIGGCTEGSGGLLAAFGKPALKWQFDEGPGSALTCEGEDTSQSKNLLTRKVLLTSAGTATVTTRIIIETPAGCHYEFKKYTATFTIPAPELVASGEATGKLSNKASAPGCASTLTTPVVFSMRPTPESAPFEVVEAG